MQERLLSQKNDVTTALPVEEYGDEVLLHLNQDQITELTTILRKTKKLKELNEQLSAFFEKIDENFKYELFIERIRKRYNHLRDDNHITDSLFATFNDSPSYVAMTLVAILGVATLGTLAITILTGGLTAIMIGSGILHYVGEYKERKKEKRKNEKEFDWMTIRTTCFKSIIESKNAVGIEKQGEESDNSFQPIPAPDFEFKEYVTKDKFIKVKPALNKAIMTTSMIIGTYYLGAVVVLAAFGATTVATALLGPIGLGIAIGLAIAIGVYCAYAQYKATINEDKTDHLKKNMQEEMKTYEKHVYKYDRDNSRDNSLDPSPSKHDVRVANHHATSYTHHDDTTSLDRKLTGQHIKIPQHHSGPGPK